MSNETAQQYPAHWSPAFQTLLKDKLHPTEAEVLQLLQEDHALFMDPETSHAARNVQLHQSVSEMFEIAVEDLTTLAEIELVLDKPFDITLLPRKIDAIGAKTHSRHWVLWLADMIINRFGTYRMDAALKLDSNLRDDKDFIRGKDDATLEQDICYEVLRLLFGNRGVEVSSGDAPHPLIDCPVETVSELSQSKMASTDAKVEGEEILTLEDLGQYVEGVPRSHEPFNPSRMGHQLGKVETLSDIARQAQAAGAQRSQRPFNPERSGHQDQLEQSRRMSMDARLARLEKAVFGDAEDLITTGGVDADTGPSNYLVQKLVQLNHDVRDRYEEFKSSAKNNWHHRDFAADRRKALAVYLDDLVKYGVTSEHPLYPQATLNVAQIEQMLREMLLG